MFGPAVAVFGFLDQFMIDAVCLTRSLEVAVEGCGRDFFVLAAYVVSLWEIAEFCSVIEWVEGAIKRCAAVMGGVA